MNALPQPSLPNQGAAPTPSVLIVGQGLAGSCLAWELLRRDCHRVLVVDRPLADTASRVAAGLVNPLTGKAFKARWRQAECIPSAIACYQAIERALGVPEGTWWQRTPIYREVTAGDAQEIWQERQFAQESCSYAGPLLPWPTSWLGAGQAGFTRGGGVLHVEGLVNALRERWLQVGIFVEDDVCVATLAQECDSARGGVTYRGEHFTHVVWCTGYEVGNHPNMAALKGRPAKGTIIDVQLPDLQWNAGILHFGHWLVHHADAWRFGATYAWAWQAPDVPEVPAVHELLYSLATHYKGEVGLVRSRAAVRPIIRRSQPVAGPVPGCAGQFVFSGLGSKGVTTAPWVATQLADLLLHATPLPDDIHPNAFF